MALRYYQQMIDDVVQFPYIVEHSIRQNEGMLGLVNYVRLIVGVAEGTNRVGAVGFFEFGVASARLSVLVIHIYQYATPAPSIKDFTLPASALT